MKIAVTGGPCGGKTSLLDTLKREEGDKIVIAPEAASIIYLGGFPRYNSSSSQGHTQRAIYFLQREIEDLLAQEHPDLPLVCDRGTLDGPAYWPQNLNQSFFDSVQTSEQSEIARYDWVIHLDTTGESSYGVDNPVRKETHQEALEVNHRIRKAWDRHPQRLIIPNHSDFYSKVTTTLIILGKITNGDSYSEVSQSLSELLKNPPRLSSC